MQVENKIVNNTVYAICSNWFDKFYMWIYFNYNFNFKQKGIRILRPFYFSFKKK